jgi:LmbE family N-acetylglucosaminyl deacetylase
MSSQSVAIIVAHPDDEVLWCGGQLLDHPEWAVFVAGLCRGHDSDRAPRFYRVIEALRARGALGALDDGPEQRPLATPLVRESILSILPNRTYDLILTHSLAGEYTRHRRHEEVARAVGSMLKDGTLKARALWAFAYEDGGGAYLPQADGAASLRFPLSDKIWQEKYRLLRDVYNFSEGSWEARTTPRVEAFVAYEHPETINLGVEEHPAP